MYKIEIIAHQVQRVLAKDIGTGFFFLIADEYTDISNQEQLTICFRWVDENLNAHEDFVGFYSIENIASDTIVTTIKGILIRLQLSLSLRQHGASNMLGKNLALQSKFRNVNQRPFPHIVMVTR